MTAPTISEGHEFVTARRTITEADVVNFAGLSNDFDPLHIDDDYAREAGFRGRIAHGQMIASIVTGLRSELDDWPVASFLGTSRRFAAPVVPGDTIRCRYRVEEVRQSASNPARNVVTVGVTVLNQIDATVMMGQDVMLVEGAQHQ